MLARYGTLREDGYVDGRNKKHNLSYWHTTPAFADCCSELREKSGQLVGECAIVVKGRENCVVWIELNEKDECSILESMNLVFFAANRLTEETAFGLLHLFHHLRDTSFTEIYSTYCIPNPRLLDLLPCPRGKGNGKASRPFFSCERLICNYAICSAEQYVEERNGCVRFRTIRIQEPSALDVDEAGLRNALALTMTAGKLCRKVEIDLGAPEVRMVDALIEVGH